MEHTYPRFALSTCQTNLSIQSPPGLTSPEIGLAEQYTASVNSAAAGNCALANYPSSPHSAMQQALALGASPGGGGGGGGGGQQQCQSNCSSPCTSPQQTATVKRKRSTNPQADENFIRALDAVRYGGIGFCKAARMFGVNNRTLWLEYKKRGYPNNRPSLKSRVKVESLNSSSSPPPASLNSGGSSSGASTSAGPSAVDHPQSPQSMGPPSVAPQNAHSGHNMLAAHSPHGMLSGYLDGRHNDYALQSSSMPINLHGVNYNAL